MDIYLLLLVVVVIFLAIAVGFGVSWRLNNKQGGAVDTQAQQEQLRQAQDQALILESQLNDREQQLEEFIHRLEDKERLIIDQAAKLASQESQLIEQNKHIEERQKLLEEAREKLGNDFELLANRIFEQKQERFNKESKSTLNTAIDPLKEQLKDFRKKVEEVHVNDAKDRAGLSEQLNQLKQLNQQMSADALNLTKALKGDKKAQGNWGEVILERVLEESGLHKGREYETQVALKSEAGQRRILDVIVRLPENKDIVIDSKVSLVDYERYCNSEDEQERKLALRDHIAAVRKNITDISFKDYENLEGLRTLDFIFVFIPIESAFMAAFEHDQAMFREAYDKNIIVVSPTTLLATLRTVQSIWRYERQNKNAEEIARQAGAMYDKFVGFVGDLDKISDHLNRASKAHEDAINKLSSGRGNLVTSTQKLKKLGAKTKKAMPASVASISSDDESIEKIEGQTDFESVSDPL